MLAMILTITTIISIVSRNTRTTETIDQVGATSTVLAWIRTAFVDIYNIKSIILGALFLHWCYSRNLFRFKARC